MNTQHHEIISVAVDLSRQTWCFTQKGAPPATEAMDFLINTKPLQHSWSTVLNALSTDPVSELDPARYLQQITSLKEGFNWFALI